MPYFTLWLSTDFISYCFFCDIFYVLQNLIFSSFRQYHRKQKFLVTYGLTTIVYLLDHRKALPFPLGITILNDSLCTYKCYQVVHLRWIKNHSSIEGNEKIDQMAQDISNKSFCGSKPAMPLSISLPQKLHRCSINCDE